MISTRCNECWASQFECSVHGILTWEGKHTVTTKKTCLTCDTYGGRAGNPPAGYVKRLTAPIGCPTHLDQ